MEGKQMDAATETDINREDTKQRLKEK